MILVGMRDSPYVRRVAISMKLMGLPYEHQRFYNLGSAATITGVSSNLSEWSLLSYMGRVNYAFMDRYMSEQRNTVRGLAEAV